LIDFDPTHPPPAYPPPVNAPAVDASARSVSTRRRRRSRNRRPRTVLDPKEPCKSSSDSSSHYSRMQRGEERPIPGCSAPDTRAAPRPQQRLSRPPARRSSGAAGRRSKNWTAHIERMI
jgi:hypothetical protein